MRVVEAVAAEVPDDLAVHLVDHRVVQHVHADLVVVPRIVRRVLEVPRELAGVDVQGDDRVGIEVVAGTRLRIVGGNRIAGAPDRELRGRVVGTGLPDAAAAGLPRVVLVFPRLAARIAGLRHYIPAPQLVSGARVECRDPSARSSVARAVHDDDLAFGGNRRRKEFLAAAELIRDGDLLVPHDLAVRAVHSDDAAVGQVRDDQVFPQRDAARARDVAFVLDSRIGHPHQLALVRLARVDLVERAPSVGGVHEPVVDERIHLTFGAVLSDILHAAQRERPDHPQVFDVLAIDLGELGISGRGVVAVHHEPVLRLVLRVGQPVPIDGHRVLPDESCRRHCRDRDGANNRGANLRARPHVWIHAVSLE